MEYDQFLEIFANKNAASDYNKELDELRSKYSELEKKYEKSLKEKDKEFKKKDKEITSLEESLKEKDKELKEKNKELKAKAKEIKSLNDLVDSSYHSSFNQTPSYHYSSGWSNRWSGLSAWLGEKKESFVDWFKEHGPLAVLGSATLAGVIGSSIYFNFSNYVAAAGIGAAVSSLFSATTGVIVDKIRCTEYEATYGGGVFGAILGTICGPISYGYINYLEKSRETPFFNNMPDAADVFAKSAIGGIAGPVAALALIALILIPTKK